MRVRSNGLKAASAGALIVLLVAACSPLATKGTVPPAGPDGEVDPGDAPDFIAVAGREEDIVGYLPKAYLFPQATTTTELPADSNWPVYAEDLRTLIGHMVAGKGFVPLGVDPATIPDIPVEQGPSLATSPGEPTALTVYVRNRGDKMAWFGRASAGGIGANGFGGGSGVGCFDLPVGDPLVMLDRAPQDPGARPLRVVYVRSGVDDLPILWIDIGADGGVTQGQGVPPWWSSDPQAC